MFRKKVLVITGARQVGKTTLLKKIFAKKDALWLDGDNQALRLRIEPLSVERIQSIIGDHKIVIIDEAQRLPNPGLLLKIMIDNFSDRQFIATGSSALEIADKIFEQLTDRQISYHLYPFSIGEIYPKKSNFEIEETLPFHLLYGTYPDIVNQPKDAITLVKNLANQYLYKDVLIWKDIRKPQLLDQLLRALALQIGSEVSIAELANLLKVKSETINAYIDLLEKSFVIFRLKAYSTNERKEITKMNKIYFWDNGIRNAIIDDFRPLEFRNDTGALWENFLISERMKSKEYQKLDARSYFWRNKQQREVDYLEVNQEKINAFELKWNSNKNHKFSQAFINLYPDAKTTVITPFNFVDFCSIKPIS